MRYKTKCICQIDPNYKERHKVSFAGNEWIPPCSWCSDTGEKEFDLSITRSEMSYPEPTVFWSESPDDPVDATLEWDELLANIKCSCGDDIFLQGDGDAIVCSCGRVYYLQANVLKDDTYRGDDEYWEKERIKKGKI